MATSIFNLPSTLLALLALSTPIFSQCPLYQDFAQQRHPPFSTGRFNLSYQRPVESCRTFPLQDLEDTIQRVKRTIVDPDLARLWENTWPNTLDTTIAWRGYANHSTTSEQEGEVVDGSYNESLVGDEGTTDEEGNQMWEEILAGNGNNGIENTGETEEYPESVNDQIEYNGPPSRRRRRRETRKEKRQEIQSDAAALQPEVPAEKEEQEELTFIVTGDIEAMWLRDSANQLQAYVPLLKPNSSFDSLASVFRGAINLQARYILEAPFCNAFQAPAESGFQTKSSMNSDMISPSYDYFKVFSCNWELDSLASFLQLSVDYYQATGDWEFFGKWNWIEAVRTVLSTAESMRIDSYKENGDWQHTPYTYCAPYGGTPINDCTGSPHKGHIGLVRSFHRPSDDACMFQYLIPSNMMFSHALNASSQIMAQLESSGNENVGNLTTWMRQMSTEIATGIETYGVVQDPKYGPIYAYEVDGYGSANLMDDPNIPSLLSAPFLNYLPASNKIYQNTRRKILSKDNPYFAWGPVISGVASQHTRPGKPWPMALVMQILTSGEEEEIVGCLRMLVRGRGGLGLMHESVDRENEGIWSRQWSVSILFLSMLLLFSFFGFWGEGGFFYWV